MCMSRALSAEYCDTILATATLRSPPQFEPCCVYSAPAVESARVTISCCVYSCAVYSCRYRGHVVIDTFKAFKDCGFSIAVTQLSGQRASCIVLTNVAENSHWREKIGCRNSAPSSYTRLKISAFGTPLNYCDKTCLRDILFLVRMNAASPGGLLRRQRCPPLGGERFCNA